jgi:hypothetical protein
MAITTTPAQRLQRVIGEGARLMALCPGQTSIDVTPDIMALLDGIQTTDRGFEPIKESIEPKVAGRDVPTSVHFT